MSSAEAGSLAVFALTIAAGQLSPGPDMLMIVKNTLNHGLRAGLFTVAGICLGLTAHVTLAFLGLGALMEKSPSLFRAVSWLGAAYLLWIAWRLFRAPATEAPSDLARGRPIADGPAFRQGLFTNLLNPKVVLFFSSILAPAALAHPNHRWLYAALILIEAVVLWPLFAWVLQRPIVRRGFFRYQIWWNWGFAVLLTLVAFSVAWPR